MASNGAALHSDTTKAHVSSAAETDNDDLVFLRRAARSLPPPVLKDLLSNGVCARCILKQFGQHEYICSRPSVTTPLLNVILREVAEHGDAGAANDSVGESKDMVDVEKELQEVCRVCLGILQFLYVDDNGILVKKSHACDFAAAVADNVEQGGYQIDSFCLLVSLPPVVVDNEQAVWSYIKEKYSSESWFTEKFPSSCITVKDFLKLSITNPLEKLLDVKCNENSFRVQLTYTLSDALSENEPISESNGCYKRRKIGETDTLKNSTDLQKVENHDLTSNSSNGCKDDQAGLSKFPLEKVNGNGCCSLFFQCYKTSVYVGGRYLKYSRNVSQSRWIIDDERMGEASVEEIVGSNILPICQGDKYKFHAAGREDIDVRMLGTGRPFLVEILNARQFPSDLLIKEIETKINSLESKLVQVKNLRFLGSQGWELMREGEAEKQKQYVALVWISRPFENEDEQKLSSVTDLKVLQKTPVRVLHRRSPLEREKIIHWMKIEKIAGSSQYFLLHLCTQAGTYIKEFVHGDLGRTYPNVGSILGCRAEILQLDVTDVKMDCFQA
ncbi:tRNA pseudouridine synthase Pus10 [Salvia splendens]|uniref:tRNA pseudouridine synthase Pus10 n=1 Tax=Salvia splendens TaxID=180675 RepID=UPI001C2574A2|nr:tRNA pseudouridine synthase Pus10 [Salvia splendens]